jgi:hypothetical protein
MPPKNDEEEYLNEMLNVLTDAKFIDFASDKYGIIFEEEMFMIDKEITYEDLEKFGIKRS